MRRSISLALAALLAACAGGSRTALLPAQSIAGTTNERASGTLVVRVKAPLHPDAFSPATKAISVRISGPTNVSKEAALSVRSSGCTSKLTNFSCDVVVSGLKPCPTSKHCYKADVATYDKFNAATGRIPPNAHELAAVKDLPFSIAAGTTLIPLVLYGLPKSIAFIPSPTSNLAGSQQTGYVEPKCAASVQDVNVIGVDADANFIVGVGAPAIALRTSDSSQLAVMRGTTPTSFQLVPPASPSYPFGNHSIALTATAAPGTKSGGKAIHATISVRYSGDICGTITEFTVPTGSSQPVGIVTGPDGNLWFTEFLGNKIGRITTGGAITEFPLPTAVSGPWGIVPGPDGNLWFTEEGTGMIAKATTSGTVAAQYPTPSSTSMPLDIIVGPDNNMWFSEVGDGSLGKVTTGGVLVEYPIATPTNSSAGLTVGPDGNIWYTEPSTSRIGYMTVAGFGFDSPVPSGSVFPFGITTGSNGELWYAQCTGNAVGELTDHDVFIGRYDLPEAKSKPAFIILGPDGNVWTAQTNGSAVASVSPSGTITEYPLPTSLAQPLMLTTGPDGAIWVAEAGSGKIARIR